jgi:hypothetical protein
MQAVYVEPVRTPVTFEKAADCLESALYSQLGQKPSRETLALALAKTVLETGRDNKAGLVWTSCFNGAVGNIKAGPNYTGMYTAYSCNEILGNMVVWFSPFGRLNRKDGDVIAEPYDAPPWHPQCRFRAYANPFDGAHSYVEFVASGRYRDAWKELLAGNPYDYTMALAAAKYFTADPLVYVKGVKSLHNEFMKKLEGLEAEPTEIPDCDEIRCLLAPQQWNVSAVRAHGQAIATEAYYTMLGQSRRDAHREMLADDDPVDNAPTDPSELAPESKS